MAKKEQKKGHCIFCGSAPLSKEHIWADWLREYIPRTYAKTNHNVNIVSGSAFESTKGKVNRPGDPHSQRLRVVCQQCNNGWMSEIQNRVKPNLSKLIIGESADLEPADRELLATWAVMFTYIWEQAEPKLITSTPEERRAFMETRLPPSGWTVWMAPYEGTLWKGRSWRRAGSTFVDSPEPTLHQSTTFAAGKIAFHTFSSPRLRIDSKLFAQDHSLYEVWPSAGNVLYLASKRRDADLAELPNMFQRAQRYFGFTLLDDRPLHALNSITGFPAS
ncbi:hypothetical protein FHX08_002084 [Rhizobium sp. BK529]|uniref:hypothetical protein n=1 Tax=Rhizobium sp. BK529 TaxID=2586983 RepID=UPI0016225C76|nr:hypothetical protein [Rhizobium sp. BK529]MBB3591740.1 hypothetical protein [Rhizobium sp. BK529]